jgi:hypothetical protein
VIVQHPAGNASDLIGGGGTLSIGTLHTWTGLGPLALLAFVTLAAVPVAAQQPPAAGSRPNILVIWGDDIGVHNVSAYNHGVMGYRTPNIDRIAKEGALFTDAYAQQSCTAGRASFILGQHPFRPKSKVGTFSDALMAESKKRVWVVISMRNDWKRIFALEE